MNQKIKVTLTPLADTNIEADCVETFIKKMYFDVLSRNPAFKATARFGDLIVTMQYATQD